MDRTNSERSVGVGDPVAYLIRNRWHINAYGLFLIMIATASVHMIVLPYLLGHFTSHGDVIGVLGVPYNLMNSFLVQPILCAYYLTMPSQSSEMFRHLRVNGVIRSRDLTSYASTLDSIALVFSNRKT